MRTMAGKRMVAACMAAMALAACMLGGCAQYPSTEEALSSVPKVPTVSASAVIEQGVLTVGVNTQNAPYVWPTSSSDALQGIDVDVALALGDQMGLDVKFVNVADTYNGASGGVCDVVMGVTSFTIPGSEVLIGSYSETAPAVFGRNVTATVTAEELSVANVGVQADSASARALSAVAPTATLTAFSTLNDAFSALESGAVQYVACDSFMGGYLACSYSDVKLAGAFALPETRGVAVAASNSELQSGLTSAFDALTASGELRSIRDRWVGDLTPITATNQVAAPAAPVDPAAAATGNEAYGWWGEDGVWYWYWGVNNPNYGWWGDDGAWYWFDGVNNPERGWWGEDGVWNWY